jgi:hypothetical protein
MLLEKEIYNLSINLNLVFFKNCVILITSTKSIILKLPKIFFGSFNVNYYSFLFINYYHFRSFIQLFKTFSNRFYFFYFFRLKLRGLGFRMKKICKYLYRFYFVFVNYFYMHLPKGVIIKFKRRRILFLSNNFCVLQTLIAHLLLVKKITAYRRKGLLYPKEMINMKPGKKKLL